MYVDQLIPRTNNHEAYRAVYRDLLRQERKLDLEDIKWSAGSAFAIWVMLVTSSIMLGAVPSAAGYMLWGACLMLACSVAMGLRAVKKRVEQVMLRHLLERGDLYLPSGAVIGWVKGRAPEAKHISRIEWVTIASSYIEQLQACDTIFGQTPIGEAQMDEVDALIEQLLADLRKANAVNT